MPGDTTESRERACAATREAVYEQEELHGPGCPLCDRPAEDHRSEETSTEPEPMVGWLIDRQATTVAGMIQAAVDALPEGHPVAVALTGLIDEGMPAAYADFTEKIRALGGQPDADLYDKRFERGREVMAETIREIGSEVPRG
jgi:hypothetical protein